MEKRNNSVISEHELKQLLNLLQEENTVETNTDYVKPQFTHLNQKENDNIHRRGLITQEEACKEWKEMNLCVPGNAGANPRCKKFNYNCEDCSIDYSLSQKEYTSLMSMGSVISTNEVNTLIKTLTVDEEKGYQKIKK